MNWTTQKIVGWLFILFFVGLIIVIAVAGGGTSDATCYPDPAFASSCQ